MASKRKHNEVTLKIKYNPLEDLEKGHFKADVDKEYNFPTSTLATWKKNKKEIVSPPFED